MFFRVLIQTSKSTSAKHLLDREQHPCAAPYHCLQRFSKRLTFCTLYISASFFGRGGNPEVVSRPAAGIIHFEKRCRTGVLQDRGYELPRTLLLDNSPNKGAGGPEGDPRRIIGVGSVSKELVSTISSL